MAVVVASCASNTPDESDADATTGIGDATVVVNAEVYTVDESDSRAEAFAFDQEGRIVAVGTEDEVVAETGDGSTVIDADGAMVMPGFQDVHVHVPEAGINAGLCFVSGQDLADLEAQVAD